MTAARRGRAATRPETSTTETVSITVDAVNDAPVNLLPAGPLTVVVDTATPIAGISIADVDAAGDDVELTLSVDHGTLTVDTLVLGGVGPSQVVGNGTATRGGQRRAWRRSTRRWRPRTGSSTTPTLASSVRTR